MNHPAKIELVTIVVQGRHPIVCISADSARAAIRDANPGAVLASAVTYNDGTVVTFSGLQSWTKTNVLLATEKYIESAVAAMTRHP